MIVLGVTLAISACAPLQHQKAPPIEDPYHEPVAPEMTEFRGGVYKVGDPYVVDGVRYVPKEDWDYDRVGIASWYGTKFHGRHTANGERFDQEAMTAAHPTLPLPSRVRVTNLENGRSIVLRVNDRGPFKKNRIIDVSRRAAEVLGFENKGSAKVRVQVLGKAPIEVFVFDKPAEDADALASVPVAPVDTQSLEFSGENRYRGPNVEDPGPNAVGGTGPVSLSGDIDPIGRVITQANKMDEEEAPTEWYGASLSSEPDALSDVRGVASRSPSHRMSPPPNAEGLTSDPSAVRDLGEPRPLSATGFRGRNAMPERGTLREAVSIQAGSFLLKENAQRLYENIAGPLRGIADVDIEAKSVRGQTRHRVLVGPLRTHDDAEAALDILHGLGYSNANIVSK